MSSKKIDFTFGENLSKPLNEYFSTYIGESIDYLVNESLKDEELTKKYFDDMNSFTDDLKDNALVYIERKYYDITMKSMDILFSHFSIKTAAYETYKNLYSLKKYMIEF